MRFRSARSLFVAVALAAMAAAPPSAARDAAAAKGDAYRSLLDLDARLLTVGWRLARANAPFCRHRRPSVGIQLIDAQSFGDADAARASLGLSGDFGIGGLAEGGPGDRAGAAGIRELVAIEARPVVDLTQSEPGDYRRTRDLHDHVDKLLSRCGLVRIDGLDPEGTLRRVTVAAEPVCAGRFEILTNTGVARSDGRRVLIGDALARKYGDAEFFPAIVAHEFAHVILRHPITLKGKRTMGRVRHSEREADRLAIWLLANAGYDLQIGPRLMREYLRSRDVGVLDLTHDAWDERIDVMEEEIAIITDLRRKIGDARVWFDWSGCFPMSRDEAKPRR
ncbi:hypothetical protein [uncultured Croceicoccus sp.]|uniref:hypothetical protein n=1 Tax=uncultured Croceicoccus sp. TaxID=1295329 RepID=UPI00260AB486|nr:hypothetical protein [uncultured Croceicoccus sp.]